MIFYVREKVFSFGDNFTIRDIDGYDAYKVKGKVFSFGNKLRLYSMDDRELVYIEQKLFKFLPEYLIYENGTVTAVLKKKFSFFKQRLQIESRYGDFYIEGDVFAHNFAIFRNGILVADIRKKVFTFGDTYEVNIDDNESYPFILSMVIVIDQIYHDDNNNQR